MNMERLDGFTADGKGNVIAGQIQDGDVVRIDGRIEQRYYAPVAEPPPVHREDALAFKRRFTAAERIAIRTAMAAGDHVIADFMDLLDTGAAVNSPVRFDDPDVIAGLGYLENTAHVLDPGRAAEILTP
jgi:hypothetical protein